MVPFYAPPMMPTPFVKRATSPLQVEPLITAPEDVLWPASDAEDSADRQRSKRRRIEAQGKRYLEGKPLFIQSASLRGPLDTGWVNPWKRKPRPKRGGILRLPDQVNIVDLTQPEPQPVPQPLIIEPRVAPAKSISSRISSTSDLGPEVGSASESIEQRARNSKAGGKQNIRSVQNGVRKLPPRSRDWLRSDNKYLKGGQVRASKSPTPTPGVRTRAPHTTPIIETVLDGVMVQNETKLPTAISQSSRTSPAKRTPAEEPSPSPSANKEHTSTMNCVHDPPPRSEMTKKTKQRSRRCSASPQKDDHVSYSETEFDLADGVTKLGFYGAKILSEAALCKARDENGHSEAHRLSQQGAVLAFQAAAAPVSSQLEEHEPSLPKGFKSPLREKVVSAQEKLAIAKKPKPQDPKNTPRELPPSSSLAGFKYRIPRKEVTKSENLVNQSPFAQQLQAAKAKAEAKTKHLSFTSSGGIRSFGSRSTSRASSVETARSRLIYQDPNPSQEGSPRRSGLVQSTSASQTNGQDDPPLPNVLPEGPEAQVAQPVVAPSGPSTNNLETDKQSLAFISTEGEEDSYLDLSTQAALAKAQQSFQDTILSPVKHSPNGKTVFHRSQPSPTAYKTPNAHLPALPAALRDDLLSGDRTVTPSKETMNTQAMIDAMSPFAMTTVKKHQPASISVQLTKQASLAQSPLHPPSQPFGTTRRSFSMSTSSGDSSPSPTPKPTPASRPPPILSKASPNVSKPLSTTTSAAFSINGTLTEVYQQDGQQQNDLAMAVDSGWDYDQALDELGSFLEPLDDEIEARKGNSTLAKGGRG